MQQLAFYFGPSFDYIQPVDLSPRKKIAINRPYPEPLEEKVNDIPPGMTVRDKFFTYDQVWQAYHFAHEHIEGKINFQFWPSQNYDEGMKLAREALICWFPNNRLYIQRRLNDSQVKILYLMFETFLDQHQD